MKKIAFLSLAVLAMVAVFSLLPAHQTFATVSTEALVPELPPVNLSRSVYPTSAQLIEEIRALIAEINNLIITSPEPVPEPVINYEPAPTADEITNEMANVMLGINQLITAIRGI